MRIARPVVRTTSSKLIRLRSTQLLLLSFLFLFVGPVVFAIVFTPEIYNWYMWRIEIPRLGKDLGFRMDTITISGECGPVELAAITEVTSGGAFDRAGLRPGDIPYGYHHGVSDFAGSLRNARGGKAHVRVIHSSAYANQNWAAARSVDVKVPPERPD